MKLTYITIVIVLDKLNICIFHKDWREYLLADKTLFMNVYVPALPPFKVTFFINCVYNGELVIFIYLFTNFLKGQEDELQT